MQESRSDNIPLQLDREEFDSDSDRIRSKLLYYRLKNYYDIDPNAYKSFIDNTLSKRLSEMIAPLICIRKNDGDFINALLERTRDKNAQLREDKSMSFEAEILTAIYMTHVKDRGNPLVQDIADHISEDTNKNYSPRFLGNILRDNFKLRTMHTRDGNVVIYEEKKVLRLLKEYNIDKIVVNEDISLLEKIRYGSKVEADRLKKLKVKHVTHVTNVT